MSELKRCPFCGGEVRLHIAELDAFRNVCSFLCDDCDFEMIYPYSNEEEAIKAFNTRKPMERILERLKEEPYINKGGELFLNGYNEDCLPLRKVFEIVKEEGGIE